MYWYCLHKILNCSSKIHFSWFNIIYFKLILLTLLLKSLFFNKNLNCSYVMLLDIFSVIMQWDFCKYHGVLLVSSPHHLYSILATWTFLITNIHRLPPMFPSHSPQFSLACIFKDAVYRLKYYFFRTASRSWVMLTRYTTWLFPTLSTRIIHTVLKRSIYFHLNLNSKWFRKLHSNWNLKV